MVLVIVDDIFGNGTGETWPSTARRKLILGKEERLPSRNIHIDALFKGLIIDIVEDVYKRQVQALQLRIFL